jgi:hypothetical protein
MYTHKTPITWADLLNDRVLPAFEKMGMWVLRMLTDRGIAYCGKVDTQDYQLYLAINDLEHTKTKVKHPQTNVICERFHKTNYHRGVGLKGQAIAHCLVSERR